MFFRIAVLKYLEISHENIGTPPRLTSFHKTFLFNDKTQIASYNSKRRKLQMDSKKNKTKGMKMKQEH